MKRAVLFLVLCIPPVGLAAAEPELKGTVNELSAYVTAQQSQAIIVGEAEIKMPADRAVMTLRLNSENKSLKEAALANQKLRAALTDYLAENSVGADRIHSVKFSSTPRTGTFSEKVKSYRLESRLRITVHDDREFQAVTGVLDRWSDVNYEGVEFAYSEKEMVRLKAVGLACDNALARKKTYEEKLGVKLSIKRFSDGADLPSYVGDRRRSEQIGVQGGTMPSSPLSRTGLPGMGGVEESTAGFGELVFKARVVIECSLEAR